jgi:hypothetical protein
MMNWKCLGPILRYYTSTCLEKLRETMQILASHIHSLHAEDLPECERLKFKWNLLLESTHSD